MTFKFNHSDADPTQEARSRLSPHPVSLSVQSNLEQKRQHLRQWLQSCRSATLDLFEGMDAATFCRQAHPDFSPVGWHLGHIAFIEELWILRHFAQRSPQFPQYHRLLAADGLPKAERANLPQLPEILAYLHTIREQVLTYLDQAPIDQQIRLWRWLLQHESQHNETITLILQLLRWRGDSRPWAIAPASENLDSPLTHPFGTQAGLKSSNPNTPMIRINEGYFEQGNTSSDALDNERMTHPVYLDTYWIDRYPVTCAQYKTFMESGGYQTAAWWSSAGWLWLQQNPVSKPLYWSDDPAWADHPVCGVSFYEAEAYANFAGKRLPTEAEWEKAAAWHPELEQRRTYPWGEMIPTSRHCNHDHWVGHTTPVAAYPLGQSAYGCEDLLGNVWEWTASWFRPYEGFKPYPYTGYSQTYFDDQHRVMRGGSWATRPWALRCAFRNWYHPHVRQVLVGFRCARTEDEGDRTSS